ncbi:MAG: response regulator [Spirochaetales bacterium]|nr:response regulator [Spirochaetales bacterium]
MKFLIVDDSRIMRNIIKNIINLLKIKDVEYREASDGIEAYKILEEDNIDILFLDWNMPHLNGLDLVRKLRSIGKFTNLPIIMITSEAAKYNVIEAVKEGVDDYIVKPIREDTFLKKLKKFIDKCST